MMNLTSAFAPAVSPRSAPARLVLRPMDMDDSAQAAALMPDLGHRATPAQMKRRLDALREWPDQEVFVAAQGPHVVGLCQVQGVRLLAAEGYAEVHALVVAAQRQRQGIGAALLRHAVHWAWARGYGKVRLRSAEQRSEAHLFYESQGFSPQRSGPVFEVRRPEV